MLYKRVPASFRASFLDEQDEHDLPTYWSTDKDKTRDCDKYEEIDTRYLVRDVLNWKLDFDLWKLEEWITHVQHYVPKQGRKMTHAEWANFKVEFEEGHFCTSRARFTCAFDVRRSDVRECTGYRLVFSFLLKHHLDIMGKLIDLDYAHVGQMLFPFSKRQSFESGGCRQSLLGMAVFDVASPKAVTFLLERGANPDGMTNRGPCAIEGPEFGLDSVANWDGSPEIRLSLLKAFIKGGADPIGVIENDIIRGVNRIEAEKELLDDAVEKWCANVRKTALQRWHNVLAALQMISFWRHFAYRPESKWAKARFLVGM
jgi:hypothetical protein